MNILIRKTRIRVATTWQRAASPTRQSRNVLSKNARFAQVALLLLLIEAIILALPASTQRKVKVRPAVLPATLLQLDSKATFIVFKAQGHRWKRDVSLAVLLKDGKRTSATSFHPGEPIVLLSTFDHFDLIDTVADRSSYAAFCHDLAFQGLVQSWQPGHSLLLSGASVYKGREEIQAASQHTEYHVQIRPETQFWLNKEVRTHAYARKFLAVGTKLFVAVRWRDYKYTDFLPAHAVFDERTWQAYARSELRTATDLFLPRTPQSKRTKD